MDLSRCVLEYLPVYWYLCSSELRTWFLHQNISSVTVLMSMCPFIVHLKPTLYPQLWQSYPSFKCFLCVGCFKVNFETTTGLHCVHPLTLQNFSLWLILMWISRVISIQSLLSHILQCFRSLTWFLCMCFRVQFFNAQLSSNFTQSSDLTYKNAFTLWQRSWIWSFKYTPKGQSTLHSSQVKLKVERLLASSSASFSSSIFSTSTVSIVLKTVSILLP